jgi:hypothetical protein
VTTLIIWGEADRIVAPVYAQEFVKKISVARVDDRTGRPFAAVRPTGGGD